MGIGSSVCLASGVPAILWRKKYNKREGGSLFSLNLFTSESWQLQHHWEYNLSFHNFLFIRFVFHASRYLLVNGLFCLCLQVFPSRWPPAPPLATNARTPRLALTTTSPSTRGSSRGTSGPSGRSRRSYRSSKKWQSWKTNCCTHRKRSLSLKTARKNSRY